MRRRCLECGNLTGSDHRRGLCRRCYRTEARDDYPPRSQRWDVAETALLITLYDGGFSDKQIARQLRRPLANVTKQRQRLGLKVATARQATHRRRSNATV